ncbi:DUF4138 domain-containing protein [Zobellia galactanivorans]|uniref:Conjugative transposon protein TraN n=1 Tax=Zobellia galactanivorans (strain DSM 12802 / CCUG 47099 / CIP 106680 / NCIMB 13871 / Dsij) TaxID=63186 RepID=G0L796_ZOBGA|nr:DUF4138 domain-containing protein [Zobellia galactanivorans]MBU3027537.1 DUF4138 domain-containing protein [Zobellia galactanivorans]CAZ97242.1 Conjugative transposon protein TraN [Zobellia galactanivorans]
MRLTQSLFILLLISFNTYSQQEIFDEIESTKPIAISDIKTTHLIFKNKIKYLDIGSRYFVTDTIENIVKVKHIGGDFIEKNEEKKTNITIITQDGDYYSIPLFFERDITNTTYKLDHSQNNNNNILMKNEQKKMGIYEMCHFSRKEVSNYNIKGNRDLLLSKVSGIFYRGDYIAIRLEIKNFSTIDLNIDHFLFRFIKDKRYAQDMVYQERVLRPVLICNETDKVRGTGGIEVFSFVFEKFTPNNNEKLQIDIIEKNGGRSTTIVIPRKKLLKPRVI